MCEKSTTFSTSSQNLNTMGERKMADQSHNATWSPLYCIIRVTMALTLRHGTMYVLQMLWKYVQI